MSLNSCETRHFKIIISTGGMPSARNRPFILSNICSFSFAGIRIHLFQSVCASASCLASSFVMNFGLSVQKSFGILISTYVESVPLLLAVARGGSGLLHGRIYPNTHLLCACEQQRGLGSVHQALEPRKTREAGGFRAQRFTPRFRLALAGFCFWRG